MPRMTYETIRTTTVNINRKPGRAHGRLPKLSRDPRRVGSFDIVYSDNPAETFCTLDACIPIDLAQSLEHIFKTFRRAV